MIATAALSVLVAVAAAPPESAEPAFRVETELRDAGGRVLDRHLWLFDGATAVDVPLDDDGELVVFDHAVGHIVLIDRARRRQTVIEEAALVRFMADLRAEIASAGKDEQFATAARPGAAPDGHSFHVAAGHYRYRATATAAPDSAHAAAFGRATNNAARLNALEGLGLPPFARMALSEELTRRGLLPEELTLRRTTAEGPAMLRVRHRPAWQLTAADEALLESVRQMRGDFAEVPFARFRQGRGE